MNRSRHIVWLAVLLTGCTLIAPLPALPTPVRPPPVESVADALQASLDGDYPLDALAIGYAIGSTAWQGRTTLVASGTGAVEVTFQLREQHRSWQSDLTETEFVALVQLLVQHQVWAIQGQRETGVPDEAFPTVTVEAEGFEPLVVGMWHDEALGHPDFQPILSALAGLASEISGGVAK